MKGKAIIRQVLLDHGIAREDFLSLRRDKHLVEARRDAARRLSEAHFSRAQIGKMMKRCEDTIRFYIDDRTRDYKAELLRNKFGMRFLDAGTREIVLEFARLEQTKPEIIIAQWVAARAEYEASERARVAA